MSEAIKECTNETSTSRKKKPKCPECGSKMLVRVIGETFYMGVNSDQEKACADEVNQKHENAAKFSRNEKNIVYCCSKCKCAISKQLFNEMPKKAVSKR